MEQLMAAMMEYDQGDPMRIHHFLKVYELARTIGRLCRLMYPQIV